MEETNTGYERSLDALRLQSEASGNVERERAPVLRDHLGRINESVVEGIRKVESALTRHDAEELFVFIRENDPGHFDAVKSDLPRSVTVMPTSGKGLEFKREGIPDAVAYWHTPPKAGEKPKAGLQKTLTIGGGIDIAMRKVERVAILGVGSERNSDYQNRLDVEDTVREAGIAEQLDGKKAAKYRDMFTQEVIHSNPDYRDESASGPTRAFMFMELAKTDGKDYLETLKTAPDGALKTIRYLEAVADSAADMHARNLVHGDLKPANSLVYDDGTVRVSDFGSSGTVEERARSVIASTRYYEAPELGQNGVYQSKKTDVYAMGVMLRDVKDSQVRLKNRGSEEAYFRLAKLVFYATRPDPKERADMSSVAKELHAIGDLLEAAEKKNGEDS